MLKETYKANIKNLPKNSVIIEVTRNKEHPLSPSRNLLNSYQSNEIPWDTFDKLYRMEMNTTLCQDMMRSIKKVSKKKDVYLVCFEKEFPCHRFILLDIINDMDE